MTGREDENGQPLDSALITRHLQFSLPYRALFSSTLRPDTARRLLDALAALLVRLHTAGFYWGDCSFSNTLFRRDAGAFAAYLVDAETGELHATLSEGQRSYDLDLARTNIAGELLDLEAGGLLHESIDPVATSDEVVARYENLWQELLGAETFDTGERYRIDQRIRRLNELGFDVGGADDRHGHRRAHRAARAQGGRRRPPQPPPASAHRARRGGEPGPPAAQRPGRLPGRQGRAGRVRGDRRPPLGGRGVRAGGPRRSQGHARKARTGRDLPRGARAPVVPLRARGTRHRPACRGASPTSPPCWPTSRTRPRCSAPAIGTPTPERSPSPDARRARP